MQWRQNETKNEISGFLADFLAHSSQMQYPKNITLKYFSEFTKNSFNFVWLILSRSHSHIMHHHFFLLHFTCVISKDCFFLIFHENKNLVLNSYGFAYSICSCTFLRRRRAFWSCSCRACTHKVDRIATLSLATS